MLNGARKNLSNLLSCEQLAAESKSLTFNGAGSKNGWHTDRFHRFCRTGKIRWKIPQNNNITRTSGTKNDNIVKTIIYATIGKMLDTGCWMLEK
jgi:hypothetical protein